MNLLSDIALGQDFVIPASEQLIYKDESLFNFDTPESENGLYICVRNFVAIDEDHLKVYRSATGQRLFINYKIRKYTIENAHIDEKPTKMGIGVSGGFKIPENFYTVVETFELVLFSKEGGDPIRIKLSGDSNCLDKQVLCTLQPPLCHCIEAIYSADSAIMAIEKQRTAQWSNEALVISKHAENLTQLKNGVKILPQSLKCQKCDLTENLWLNLTDGSILCGRRHWDGTGGNNHALEHYTEHKYPLAVKLGTISSAGADVFSYDEDDMVLDPLLDTHLAHFGIDIMKMKKTDKTVAELEIEMNERTGEWLAIEESGHKLLPIFGPGGFTGMHNLGNSCYINSAIQAVFTIPSIRAVYSDRCDQIISEELSRISGRANASVAPTDLSSYLSFAIQMAKLGQSLFNGRYSVQGRPEVNMQYLKSLPPHTQLPPPQGIKPQLFRMLIGASHKEFATKEQQDVQEFLLHLLNQIHRDLHARNQKFDPLKSLRIQVVERLQCTASKTVRYNTRTEYILSLPICMSDAVRPEGSERPIVDFAACLKLLGEQEQIDDYLSPATNQRGSVLRRIGLANFPDFIWIQARRFEIGENWLPRKLDVELRFQSSAPCGGGGEDILVDLSKLGMQPQMQPGEQPMPTAAASPDQASPPAVAVQQPSINEAIVEQLMNMGFPVNGCKRAVLSTGNQDPELALNWILEHMNDSDFDSPLVMNASSPPKSAAQRRTDPALVSILMEMGFSHSQSETALIKTDGNIERAADYAFNHINDEEETPMECGVSEAIAPQQEQTSGSSSELGTSTGTPIYRLYAMISHMGPHEHSGHYVCHIRRAGKWVIFNDENVSESVNPPFGFAYIYCFCRVDLPDVV